MKTRFKAIICSALSLFLGGIGIQKFYLGQYKRGVLYVLFFFTGIPYLLCVVDLLRFIFMSDDAFNMKYNSSYFTDEYSDNSNNDYKYSYSNELNSDKESEVYANRFDNAVEAQYSYVDDDIEKNTEKDNYNTEDELISKALQYYSSINECLKSITDYEFASNIRQLNSLFMSVIDKAKNSEDKSISRRELDKMLEYNIPTILKLINSYIDLSYSKTVNGNIIHDIKDSVSAVIEYLKKVSENIQKDDIMDITSDIDVLKSTLRKGGYI
ncbi:TM2 domain-containing protein [Brachyspira sp. G79]|uniref:TM2 domain-containing protein n=1 Tax=Brachyspira sp. G79 TaxID=1358104 RepID=UPI000BBBF2E7|nr:TM2 domain-containing protein [Brachyspira sp. G79]PCG19966.1 membrane protein [Brachyspira sp. G79]